MSLLFGISQQKNSIWNGLQSYYRMTTGTTVTDYGKNGYNGTSSNVTWVAGKNGNGGSFNNTTSKIELANNTLYDFERTDSFTISLWLKRLHIGGAAFIFSKLITGGAGNGYYAYFSAATNKIWYDIINNSSTNYIALLTTYVFNSTASYYHLVFTYNGTSDVSGMKVYCNSVDAGAMTTTNTLTASVKNTSKFQIGSNSATSGADAIIDEVGIWNRALTQAEVTALYNSGIGLVYNIN